MFCELVFEGHAGSTESNHGPTAGLKTLMHPESAAVIAVCCETEITGVRTHFQNKQPGGRAG